MLIPGGPFLERPEILRAHFGEHNSHCIFETNASRDTKLCKYFNFLLPLQHMKRPALQNKWVGFLPIGFRGRKISELLRNGPQITVRLGARDSGILKVYVSAALRHKAPRNQRKYYFLVSCLMYSTL